MKTTILMSLTVLCIVVLSASTDPVKRVTAKPDLVIGAFIDAQMHNDAKLINEILDDEALLNVSRGKEVVKFKKRQLVDFYKKIGYINLNCTAEYQILSQNENVIISRVDFKFDHFLQQNFVTIEKDKKDAWKIVNVSRFNIQ